MRWDPTDLADDEGVEVWIHIYDLGPVSKYILNSWVKDIGVPAAGAFHCGVEVCGVELAFQALPMGCEPDSESGKTMSGIWAHEPKKNPAHVYRESVSLGKTTMGITDIQKVIDAMTKTWLARSYHYVNKNCVDFAEELSSGLGVPQPFPQWAHGLAKSFLLHTPLSSVGGPGACASVGSRCCGSECSNGGELLKNDKKLQAL